MAGSEQHLDHPGAEMPLAPTVDVGKHHVSLDRFGLFGAGRLARFFDGLDMVEPGLVWVPKWRPEPEDPEFDHPKESMGFAGVGRVP
jgi:hypothetical protein